MPRALLSGIETWEREKTLKRLNRLNTGILPHQILCIFFEAWLCRVRLGIQPAFGRHHSVRIWLLSLFSRNQHMFGNNRSFTKHARRVQKLFSPRLCFVLLICPVQAGHSFDPSILGLCLVLTSLCHDVVGPDKPGDHIDFNPISFHCQKCWEVYWDFMYERRANGAGCKHLYSIQAAGRISGSAECLPLHLAAVKGMTCKACN